MKRRVDLLSCLIWLCLLVGIPELAWAQKVEGFFELRSHAYLGVDGEKALVVERLRPELSWQPSERLGVNAVVELGAVKGRDTQEELERTLTTSDLGPLLAAAGCVWPDREPRPLELYWEGAYARLERLYLDLYLKKVDLRLGRQAVNWGSGFMVNPTDPFPEVLLTEPWRPRAGVNALRATVPLGQAHQVQAVVGTNDDFDAFRAAGRATLGLGLADISAVGAWRGETGAGLVGLDVRGTAGVGYWLEGAVHLEDDPSLEAVVGVDYSFPVLERLVVSAQYYRNGAGSKTQEASSASGISSGVQGPICPGVDGLFGSGETESDPFAPVFRGRDYGMLSVSLGIKQEVTASALWMQNLGDGSGLLVPSVTVVPNGWLEVAASAQLPFSLWGAGGELHPNEDDLVLTVETGGAPIQVALGGLVPSATFSFWLRANY